MHIKETFAERLVKLREERDLTQQVLADYLGITRQSLSLYEKADRSINIEIIYKLARCFDVSADYLLGLNENATTDADLQAACKYTGLSEKAVSNLADYTKKAFGVKYLLDFDTGSNNQILDLLDCYKIDVINTFFESCFLHELFPALILYLSQYSECTNKKSSTRSFNFAKWNLLQQFTSSLDDFVNSVYDKEKQCYKFEREDVSNGEHNSKKE